MLPHNCAHVLIFIKSLICDNSFIFFFNDTATTEIYTLSLHDALPILLFAAVWRGLINTEDVPRYSFNSLVEDRKSTRLNSSHQIISYAVFCLKKKNKKRLNPGFLIHPIVNTLIMTTYLLSVSYCNVSR